MSWIALNFSSVECHILISLRCEPRITAIRFGFVLFSSSDTVLNCDLWSEQFLSKAPHDSRAESRPNSTSGYVLGKITHEQKALGWAVFVAVLPCADYNIVAVLYCLWFGAISFCSQVFWVRNLESLLEQSMSTPPAPARVAWLALKGALQDDLLTWLAIG